MEDTILRGTILKGVGGLYGVRPDPASGETDGALVLCSARGVFRHEKITPLPGDEVVVEKSGEGEAVISEILPRKNSLVRPALANLTHLFTVIPAAKPKPDLLTADKLICAADFKGIEPVIVITKTDVDREFARTIADIYRTGGFCVFPVSCVTGEGIAALETYLQQCTAGESKMTAAFAGVSGAGKSTLMGTLFPDLALKTGEVSRKIQRGRHTTRHAELYPVRCGAGACLLADTPGFSMLDFARFSFFTEEELPYAFREMVPHLGTCRYTKCTHRKEEGCAILSLVKSGALSQSRHEHYCTMLEEIRKNPRWKQRREEHL